MNILVVSPWLPYPETWGAALRLANTVRGLAQLGEIDLFVIGERKLGDTRLPPAWRVRRVGAVVAPSARITPVQRLLWLAGARLPRKFLAMNYDDVRAAFERWRAGAYDLVWFFRVECHVILGSSLHAPAVVDIDDLEDHKIAARLTMERLIARHEPGTVAQRLRRAGVRLLTRRDMPLWRALQAQVARSVAAVVVSSEVDRRRLGVLNAHVIANGYEEQAAPIGRVPVGDPPTITFIGLFQYGPNIDAAAFLVREILPRLRSRIPSVRVRLVGHASEGVRGLHRPPGVVVTGFVPDIRSELAQADLIVVPVQYGGGTRIKILEAFAHRIPVVSTTNGAEGIEAVRGSEILLEDRPEGFAQACATLLTDLELRQRVADAAHRLFLARYRWSQVQDAVEALASQVAGGRAGHAPGNGARRSGR